MKKVLTKSSFVYLMRHPWQVGLSILGIAIGVSVVISIDIANESARKAFQQSMESVAGKSTHHIVGGPKGIPDSTYYMLRSVKKFRNSAPILEGTVTLLGSRSQTFTLLGVDPFAERPFRNHFSNIEFSVEKGFAEFISNPQTIVLSEAMAQNLNLFIGDTVRIKSGSREIETKLIGFIKNENERNRTSLQNIILTDIGSAQTLLGMNGYLSRIDLIIDTKNNSSEMLANLENWISNDSRIIRSESRTQTAEQMVKAFQINLTALSLLTLIVGMFLIYNTMTFSVVQRKVYLGLLRAVGVTRKEIFNIIIKEAFILGLVGTALGIGLGIILGKGMVRLISQTINDLYFVLSVRSIEFSWLSLLKGLALGTGATILSAIKPAHEATTDTISVTLKRSSQESKLKGKIPLLTTIGVGLLLGGALILYFSSRNIILSYVGILALILGFSFLTPLTIKLFVIVLNPVSRKLIGLLGRMASQSIYLQMSRTAVAIAALGLAVAATVGVGTMIGSFRSTVVKWLEDRIRADVYISAPTLVSRRNDATIPAELLNTMGQLPEINHINYYREIQLNFQDKIINLIGVGITENDYATFKFKSVQSDNIWPEFRNGTGVLITEPYAFKNNLVVNDRIELPTKDGIKKFKVLGIYYDYGTDVGLVTMDHSVFLKYLGDPRLSGISVFVNEETNLDVFTEKIRTLLPAEEELIIRTNRYLRQMSIEIFDRTFIIANVLQILAIIVAFIGIFSALMALQMERSRELGVLRANGLTPRQLWGLTNMQTGLMGLVAGFLSIPLGFVLAWVLIYIINQRSFGWTLQMEINPVTFIQAVLLAVIAALLAGIYPAFKMSKTSPALALREE